MSFFPETRRWRAAAATTCLWALAATPAAAQVAPGDAPGAANLAVNAGAQTSLETTERAFARLRTAAPGAHLDARLSTGLRLALPGETNAARALAFVAAYGGVFALSAGDALVERSTRGRTVRLEQQHAGTPVRNAGVTFAFAKDGTLMGYTNETQAIAEVRTGTLDEAGAARLALATLGVPDTGRAPLTRRTLVARGGEATVVYEVDLMVQPPLDVRRVLVDAVAGRVIGQEKLVRP